MKIKTQNGTKCKFCVILCISYACVRNAQNGTEWHRMAQNDTEWHRIVQNGTEMHRKAQYGTE